MTSIDKVHEARQAADTAKTQAKKAKAAAVTARQKLRAARAAADEATAATLAADRDLRRACVAALADNPLRQVSIASGVSRPALYKWAADAKLTQPATTKEPQS